MYQLIRKLLFRFPAESVHYFAMEALQLAQKGGLMRFELSDARYSKKVFGLKFRNVVGLGAGFDKNAVFLDQLEKLGFGFVEIGTVTPLPQEGNEKPRLFRLPADQALINRMGFNNDGAKAIAERLATWRSSRKTNNGFIVGGNIGKNKVTPNEEAWKDYETCFKLLHPYVDYFTVNVSSPNTPGLRELQEKESLRKILRHLQMINNAKSVARPILLKIAPDLTIQQIDDVINLALEIKLDGIVATNTTINRYGLATHEQELTHIGAGGVSGKPLQKKSTEIVKYIHEKTNGAIPIIASGGIFTAADAKEKIDAGADLVQVWTGFIYEGPMIVRKILQPHSNKSASE